MINPSIKTKVVHSKTKLAWNIIGTQLGLKYKIAQVSYDIIEGNEILTFRNKSEAFIHAEFISYCFNNSDSIVK